MFGPCKVCAEKDKAVVLLTAEIAFLRQLVRPDVPKNAHRPSVEQLEADAVISGHDTEIFIDAKSQFIENSLPRLTQEELEAVEERDRILSGTY